MGSMAQQKRGKSRWAFTAPKAPKKVNGVTRSGLAYLQWDNNYEHVLAWARKQYGKDAIKHVSYRPDPKQDIKVAHRAEWERFVGDFAYCVRHNRSVVVDTMSEVNDVRKVAEFGRTLQIMNIFYGSFYADYRALVRDALDNDANVIFVHRMKDEYINNERTGGLKLEGWYGMAYESQVLVEHARDDDGNFKTIVRECAQDAMLNGMEFTTEDDENDFAHLAQRIYPDTELEDWR